MAASSEEGPVVRKHYIPLESDPEIFTSLIHDLGFSEAVAFEDVLTLDDPELIAFVPRPAGTCTCVCFGCLQGSVDCREC